MARIFVILLITISFVLGSCAPAEPPTVTPPPTTTPTQQEPAPPTTSPPEPEPTTSPIQPPTTQGSLTEEQFKSLLTLQDVQQVLVSQVELKTKFYNFKEMAGSTDTQQTAVLDSFYSLSFQTEDGMKAMTLGVLDFDSSSSAEQHFQKVRNSGMERMQEPIGNESFAKQINSKGLGSMVIFLKGDKCVQLHTAMSVGESPIVDMSGLKELANKVEGKL